METTETGNTANGTPTRAMNTTRLGDRRPGRHRAAGRPRHVGRQPQHPDRRGRRRRHHRPEPAPAGPPDADDGAEPVGPPHPAPSVSRASAASEASGTRPGTQRKNREAQYCDALRASIFSWVPALRSGFAVASPGTRTTEAYPARRAARPSFQNRLCRPMSPRAGIRIVFSASATAWPMRCATRPCRLRIASVASAPAGSPRSRSRSPC